MARQDFPYCKFRFFPRWSLWSEGGWGGPGEGAGHPLLLWCTAILILPCVHSPAGARRPHTPPGPRTGLATTNDAGWCNSRPRGCGSPSVTRGRCRGQVFGLLPCGTQSPLRCALSVTLLHAAACGIAARCWKRTHVLVHGCSPIAGRQERATGAGPGVVPTRTNRELTCTGGVRWFGKHDFPPPSDEEGEGGAGVFLTGGKGRRRSGLTPFASRLWLPMPWSGPQCARPCAARSRPR